MKLNERHVVITGGTTGIGFHLAKTFLSMGNEVLVIDFDDDNIADALSKEPKMKALKADLSKPEERTQLIEDLDRFFPNYDIFINNAGIQRWVNLKSAEKDWDFYHQELAINFEAPLHLATMTLKHLLKQETAAIVNVSSGLVINPGAWVPFYTAGKTGVHGFTESLRLQLQDTPIKVFEVFPPAVNTALGGAEEHSYGVSLDDFIPSVIKQLSKDQLHITYGTSNEQFYAAKEINDETTLNTWNMFKNNPSFLKS